MKNVYMHKISNVILICFILILSGCIKTKLEEKSNNQLRREELKVNESATKLEVVFEILDKSSTSMRLRLVNNLDKPIFVIYEALPNSDLVSAQYTLICQNKKGKPKQYAPSPDASGSREQIDAGATIEFKVEPLPKTERQCNVSILYYDDYAAEKLVNKAYQDNFVGYSEQERAIIESGKKVKEISFEVSDSAKY